MTEFIFVNSTKGDCVYMELAIYARGIFYGGGGGGGAPTPPIDAFRVARIAFSRGKANFSVMWMWGV